MVHYVRGLAAPVANANIAGVYAEVVLTVPDVETFVSPIGGAAPKFPKDSGELVNVVSTSASDTGTVQLQGLDSDFKVQTEDITLNGITPVSSTKQFTRINELFWLEKTAFVGDLSVTDTTNTDTYRSATATAQISLDSHYSIPDARRWTIDSVYAGITQDAGGGAIMTSTAALYIRPVGFAFRRSFKFSMSNTGNSTTYYPNSLPAQLDGPADMYVTVTATAATAQAPTEVVTRCVVDMGL